MTILRVLIVEDDARIAELHRRFVEKVGGFEVVGIALNLTETREMVELLDPDLLLLDLYLPDGNGMDMLRELRGQGRQIDVVLITAAKEVNAVQQALQNGAFDYLIKPVMFPRFAEALHKFQRYHVQLHQVEQLDQTEIDQLRQGHSVPSVPGGSSVPKGIDLLTLGKVQHVFHGSECFSAEEVAASIGASRSTARRYLEYLITTGELRADIVYGSVGRPERRYFVTHPSA
ncbi:MAG: response regulator [Desulfuromonas sp.]|nr:response regulator [Desulfuromonas sp.]